MANDNKGMSAAEINRRMKEEMNAVKSRLKDQGLDDMEIKQIMQDYFVKAEPKKKAKKMVAARGGVAKKKMMRGGVAKKTQPKRMRGGGMAKMAKKKMMRGGVAKKK
jgi:hypothetical protein